MLKLRYLKQYNEDLGWFYKIVIWLCHGCLNYKLFVRIYLLIQDKRIESLDCG